MKTTAAFLMFTLILAVQVPAFAQPFDVDRIILVNSTEREGRIISIDAADIQFQENPRGKTKLIPLAEVRQVAWANGQVTNWSVVEDPLPGENPGSEQFVRTSGRYRRDDLELSRREVTYNAFGRGVMAGSIATFFTSDGDEKKIAFAAGFLAHFSISLYAGW